jgi:hypothetical protein
MKKHKQMQICDRCGVSFVGTHYCDMKIKRNPTTLSDLIHYPKSSIDIGRYTIKELANNTLFIEHESGEGMGVNKEDFEKFVDEFYKNEKESLEK